jgi:putative ABC transport system permease protein
MTADDYARLTGDVAELERGEVLVYSRGSAVGNAVTIAGTEYSVKEHLNSYPQNEAYMAWMFDVQYFVVRDDTVLTNLIDALASEYNASLTGYVAFNLSGSADEKIAAYQTIKAAVSTVISDNRKAADGSSGYSYNFSCRQASADEVYELYGGFLFLGLFLGALFLMATVLIIYYKQVSEGYEDKERFEIMQKVGMGRMEIRSTIRSQILMVFFLPLLMAALHIAAAFPMIRRLLAVLNLSNVTLFVACTVCTVMAFAGIYAVVYALTARAYYKIVS